MTDKWRFLREVSLVALARRPLTCRELGAELLVSDRRGRQIAARLEEEGLVHRDGPVVRLRAAAEGA